MYLNQQLKDSPSGFSIAPAALAGDSRSRGATDVQGEAALRNHLPTLSWTGGGGETGTFNGKGVLYKPAGEEMGQVSMLSSVALSFFPGGGKTQRSGRAAEGHPALGTSQNRGLSFHLLQVRDACREELSGSPSSTL